MEAIPAGAVLVTAPSRLHFGFVAFGPRHERQFGGVGVMIDRPVLRLRLERGGGPRVQGPHAERVRGFAEAWRLWRRPPVWEPRIDVLQAPPQHVGLGVGTQLALATGEGLERLYGYPPTEIQILAEQLGRARRSAVGTYGFRLGGLIVDGGKPSGQPVGDLDQRLALPEQWRFVLMRPADQRGLAGWDEHRAFGEMQGVPDSVARTLHHLLYHRLLPSAQSADFDGFSETLYEYGRVAGSCFASVQHGSFATPESHELVERLGQMGIRGRGQSSWGPTLFGLVPDAQTAERLMDRLRGEPGGDTLHLEISAVSEHGALIKHLPEGLDGPVD
jgi:beta-RFAP synthase